MKQKLLIVYFFILLFVLNSNLLCVESHYYLLTKEKLSKNVNLVISDGWEYKSDNNFRSLPDSDNNNWTSVANTQHLNNLSDKSQDGVFWLRLHLKIDSTLQNKTFLITTWYTGKLDLFLDGKYICSEANWRNPKTITFSNKTDYILSVRYLNHSKNAIGLTNFLYGFRITIGYPAKVMSYDLAELHRLTSQQMFFTALILAFGLLHLILYLNYRQYKGNFLYSLFLFVYACTLYLDYQVLMTNNANEYYTVLQYHRAFMAIENFLCLLFLYNLFNYRFSKNFWIVTSLLLISGIITFFSPIKYFIVLEIVLILVCVEIVRIIKLAIKQKQEGVWLIASGFLILLAFSLYDLLVDIKLIPQLGSFENGYPFGTIGLFICMSVYIAKDFAKANIKIIEQDKLAREQEIERRILEADNLRKTKELEDARKLQLSLLPNSFPQLDNVEISARMKTAAEVGGDYYDYHISDDGTITVTIGDATGHGTKAGIMVILIKSIFDSMAHTFYIPDFFNHCTKVIKRMNLGNLYMGLSVIKIRKHLLTASAAGMPPILYYNFEKKETEEIILKGMPTGAVQNFVYQQQTRELHSGDTLLMMTDGFVEMFNDKKELFDYERAKEVFHKCAELSPNEILDKLFKTADEWQRNTTQEDDISFVVIKIK